jgi:drug/metabolite transporter (DMT)-like permease
MAGTTATGRRATAGTYVLLAAGMALFGSATPVSKMVGEAFPALLASGLRMVSAAAVLVPMLVMRQARGSAGGSAGGRRRRMVPELDRRDWLLLLGIAAVGTFGFTLFLFYGLRIVPGTVGSVIMATTPAVTAVGAVLFLHDRPDRWIVAGIALAVAGVLAVNLTGPGTGGGQGSAGQIGLWLGSLLVFGAVCCEATYSLLGKRLGADLSAVQIAALAAVLAGLLFAPPAIAQAVGFDWTAPSWAQWLALGWWGAGTMGLGSVLWFRGMMRVSGTTASGFMAVMPLSALLLSYLLLGEPFAWIHLVGMAGVLGGIAAITYRDARANR